MANAMSGFTWVVVLIVAVIGAAVAAFFGYANGDRNYGFVERFFKYLLFALFVGNFALIFNWLEYKGWLPRNDTGFGGF